MLLLRERIDAYSGRLTPSDRAVLDVLLSHPAESAFLAADRVTARANVHVAAATRLAKKLGYPGYPGLRESLQSELLAGVGAADRIRNTLAHADPDDVLASLVADETAALSEAVRAVPRTELDSAARQLLAARRILIFARGNATPLAEVLQRRLRRSGLDARVIGGSNRDIAEDLVSLSQHDVLFCIALRVMPSLLPALLATAAGASATTVLLTDTVDIAIRPRPDLVLAAPRGGGREYQSLTVPMAVANALVLNVAAKGGIRTMRALERLDELIELFGD
jgi:DNA-binding MurR/RpiR family transcriptional regulator